MSKSFNVTLSDEAADVLVQSAPGERKKGEWLSELIVGRMQSNGEGVLERIESRLARIESRLAMLAAERQSNNA